MITLTVGTTGDYSTFGDLLTYLRGIDPLGDDYTIKVQDETFAEEVYWDVDNGGNTVTIEPVDGASPIIDGESMRDHAIDLEGGGGLVIKKIQMEDCLVGAVCIHSDVSQDVQVLGCSFYRCLRGVNDTNNDMGLLVQGCYFEDMDEDSVDCYSYNGLKVVRGCHAHWTATGPTADFGFEFDGTGDADCVIEGCRVTTDDVTKGPSAGVFGANYTVKRCKVTDVRGIGYRHGWGSVFRLEDCLYRKTGGASYYGIWPNGGTWTILRCLMLGDGASFEGVHPQNNSVVTLKNCGFVGLTGDVAVNVDAGSTVDNSYNGYYDCDTNRGGDGDWNEPETGEVTADPQLYGPDGDLIPEGSPWEAAGNADGLPTIQTNPDIGCEELMPANLMEN